VRKMHLTPARSLDDAMKKAQDAVGRDPEINIIPGGPSTIPLLE